MMENEDFGDEKEALIRKLNRNVNKFYPDVGGIMMGYQGIKMKRSTSYMTPTPVNFRAEFFLFRPQVGSDLLCVVMKREEGRITYLSGTWSLQGGSLQSTSVLGEGLCRADGGGEGGGGGADGL